MTLARFSPKIGTTLQVLFVIVTAIGVGALGFPIYGALHRLRESERVVQVTEAGREVFVALQNTRTQRGPTRVALGAKPAASGAFLAMIASVRQKGDPAIARVIELCRSIDCTGGRPEVATGFPTSVERLASVREQADAALRMPLDARRSGLSGEFNAAATDAIDRLEAMSVALGEAVRMVDTDTAELMAVKQAAWLTRDGIGLERTALLEARSKGEITPALDRTMADLRGRALVNWSVLNELLARSGAPAELKALTKAAQSVVFEAYEKARRTAYEDITARHVSAIDNDELDRLSTSSLEALTAISDAAMRLTQSHAEQKREAIMTQLVGKGGLLAAALVLAFASLMVVRIRVVGPITAMTGGMRRLSDGDLDAEIAGTGRRDEFGEMARAVQVFKDGLIRMRDLEAETAQARLAAEDQRKVVMRDMADGFERAVGGVIDAVTAASTELQATASRKRST